MTNIYKLVHIDDLSATPKYLQIANCIINGIEQGQLEKDDLLPSINELSFELDISRDTAEKAYRQLKKQGILGSIPGKGYFIQTINIGHPLRIFLLFNKLSAHKKIIYDSLVASLGDKATIDFYIYNNDFLLFKRLITENKNIYSNYVIIPHFLEGGQNAHEIINTLPGEKLLLLDKQLNGIKGNYAAVFENFEDDIYGALEKAIDRLKKYSTLKIIFPEYTYYPVEIVKGFLRFCQDYAFPSKVVHRIEDEIIDKGEVYINVMEDDLVLLIEKIISQNLQLGKDVGLISFNETPLKKFIANGITTISTNFQQMGAITAQLILEKSTKQIAVPFYLTLRPSL
ncbi:MAG: GntR family transcriptional regulator [Chitinophagaceae bacterium]